MGNGQINTESETTCLERDERHIGKGRDSASQKEAIAIRHNDFKR